MSASVFAGDMRWSSVADSALKSAARWWFLVAVCGQAIFVLYVMSFYGITAAHGDFAKWEKILSVGYVAGDTMGNLTLMAHLLLAAIVTVGGPLQLIPDIRSRAPTFHHWNGRVFLVAAVTTAIAGLYMEFARSHIPSVVMQVGSTLNAILILFCAAMALRYAPGSRLQDASPLGASLVPRGERKLVLPRRIDVLDRHQRGARRLRSRDVPGPGH